MNWDAVGAIAESIGAIGVMISLAYLSIQVRTSNRYLKIENQDRVNTHQSTFRMALITDPDVATIMDKGLQQTEPLTRIEVIRFDALMSQLLWGCYQAWQRYYEDDDGSWRNGTAPTVVSILRTPGGANWWRRRKAQFIDEFVRAVDEAQEAAIAERRERANR